MIDLDRLERRLELSLTEDLRVYRTGRVPAPAPEAARLAPEPVRTAPAMAPAADFPVADLDLAGHALRVAELLAHGDRDGTDRHIAAHAALAAERGRAADRRDAAALATMMALLDGRPAEARPGSDAVLALGREAGDPEPADRYWAQRLWIVLEWGDETEHGELLDHCRERAYGHDEPAWMGVISLVLARVGQVDEARAAFDAASRTLESSPAGEAWVDLATDLAEAAALLGDSGRAATVSKAFSRTSVPPVTLGRWWVCKGATARYRGLLAAALGRWDQADGEYRAATELQRRLEAGPLLARTLHEWGRALQGRDDLRSRSYLREGATLGRRLGLADFLSRSGERAS